MPDADVEAAQQTETAEDEQSEERRRRFQHEHNRKVEPNPVRISVPQDERLPAPGSQYHRDSSQVQPGRHEQPAQRHCGCAMAETVKHVGSLMHRKNEIKQVDGKRSPENALKGGAPASSPPGPHLRLAHRLARNGAPPGAKAKTMNTKNKIPAVN